MPIGNDVVDLRDPETLPGGLHPRFDARVFTPEERGALEDRPEAARRRRWRLWAAKEAAFKVARKLDPATSWSPVRFAVREPGSCAGESTAPAARRRGRVECAAGSIEVEWDESQAWVHARAWSGPAEPHSTVWGVAEASERDLSRAVRRLARERMAARLSRPIDQLQVRMSRGRSARIPSLWVAGRPVALDLSLSHHGRLVAFACLSPERAASISAAGAPAD
ncbi:MAG: 4'-phosphopantetheinyl transferase superfamily protein [Myxococcota bacterium]